MQGRSFKTNEVRTSWMGGCLNERIWTDLSPGTSFLDHQITQEISDSTRIFRLLGSDRWEYPPPSSVHIHDDTGVNFCSDVLPQRCVSWRALEADDRALTRNRYTRWPRPAVTAASLCQGCCGSLLPLLGGCERMCVQCFYSRETPKSSLSKIPFLQIRDMINNFKKKTSVNEHLKGTGSFWCLYLRY